MDNEILITIIASLGIGGLIANFIQAYLANQNRRFEQGFLEKEKRYKALTILMWTMLNPKSELDHLAKFRPDIPNEETLKNELKLELFNSILFADDNVLRSLRVFIESSTNENFVKTAVAIRKDLYGNKTKISYDDLKI